MLLLPLVAGIALMSLSLLADNWDAFYPRYLYCTLPGFGIFAALGLRRAFGERAARVELGRAHGAAAGALGAPVDGFPGDFVGPGPPLST